MFFIFFQRPYGIFDEKHSCLVGEKSLNVNDAYMRKHCQYFSCRFHMYVFYFFSAALWNL